MYQHCGNCVMFRADNSCDLVKGLVLPGDVCDKWEAKEGEWRLSPGS